MELHDKATILNKYDVAYYICPNCGFIQTENPYWLEESYSKAIATADTGIMSRNLQNAPDLLFFMRFINGANFLDFGGGHGILTRIMRDYGYNFYHYDKYAENLFANGFEGGLDERRQIDNRRLWNKNRKSKRQRKHTSTDSANHRLGYRLVNPVQPTP